MTGSAYDPDDQGSQYDDQGSQCDERQRERGRGLGLLMALALPFAGVLVACLLCFSLGSLSAARAKTDNPAAYSSEIVGNSILSREGLSITVQKVTDTELDVFVFCKGAPEGSRGYTLKFVRKGSDGPWRLFKALEETSSMGSSGPS